MTTYRVEPNGVDDTALWRYESDDDQRPKEIAVLLGGETIVSAAHESDHGVVFRAAAAVLAPDEAVVLALAKALHDAAGLFAWETLPQHLRDAWAARAEAGLDALRQHAEGSAS